MSDGGVIWITGLSGVGKTTVATLVRDRFAADGRLPVLLDGDRMRQAMPQPPGYAEADRRRLARTYSGLAREFSAQGHLVVCATVSLFHTVHAWNRAHLPRYLEVFLKAPLEELRRRGVRPALYGDGDGASPGGPAGDVVGVGIAAELPVAPHLAIDVTTTDPDQAADLIVRTYTASAIPAQAAPAASVAPARTATANAAIPAAGQEGAHGG